MIIIISATCMVLVSGLFVFFSHKFGLDRDEACQLIVRIFISLLVIAGLIYFFYYYFTLILGV
ncbi:hypothetical protein HMPREF2778_00240 [Neisseria sp. HMSC075C12]|nr:hypothetical protein HMPREF2778_00240 [Neisseria sp. HMSC075C12]